MEYLQPVTSIGIDIGGTFTDFVIYSRPQGALESFKLRSTPDDPAEVVLQGIKQILDKKLPEANKDRNSTGFWIIHGSTVATNALLERKGARTALITTRGFSDVLQIGRQNRQELYNFFPQPLPPLIPETFRFEVDERVDSKGNVLHSLDPTQVETIVQELHAQEVESVAVCLLFSFLHPEHEQIISQRLRASNFLVSQSCEILPEYREYERASTTAVNAYVSPILDHYLKRIEKELSQTIPLRVMQSNGGQMSISEARQNGVRCILSGPAGGVIGAKYVSQLHFQKASENSIGDIRVISFDMGGTSTDVSLIEGSPQTTNDAVVGGCPIRIPVLDIHTIGAGGGSIAKIDAGGALRVGPQSAGAMPGPACYGKGNLPTVTDANLVLGRIPWEHFLGGQMPLSVDRAELALEQLGKEAGLDPIQAALGVVEVVNAHMERALRMISVERGHDPRFFTLLSFGGAGGLHAADLARRLGIPQVLAPPLASTLSAFGMLAAQVVKDYIQTVMLPGITPLPMISELLQPLVDRGAKEVQAEGISPWDVLLETFLDIRYSGQSYELTVPFNQQVLANFQDLHQETYGYALPDEPIEIVNLRLRAVGKVAPPPLTIRAEAGLDPTPALIDQRKVVLISGPSQVPFFQGESLLPGNKIPGPAVIIRPDTTILFGAHDCARVDSYGNLLINIGKL